MEHRYKKFVFEAEEGITLDVSEGTNGELVIRARNIIKINNYSGNYVNPPVPEGWEHLEGEWNNGYVIQRISDGSQFVWIPVGSLDADGTLDGVNFCEKFGRRNYRRYEFDKSKYHEELEDELFEQFESVKKYGGFYISRYEISKGSSGKPQSVKGAMPMTKNNFSEVKFEAAIFEDTEEVKSHLTFGAEYDSILAWFIKSEAKTFKEITKDSTDWGNYSNAKNTLGVISRTGSFEERCVNNIYDLAGNVFEWTQEKFGDSYRVIRGGYFAVAGSDYPVEYRHYANPFGQYSFAGFRVSLRIK